MTTTASYETAPATTHAEARETLALAGAAGLALGVLDLVLIQVLPYPWADLANSSAIWALAAFALGRLTRSSVAVSGTAGAVMLVVAVESYYLAAIAVDLASPDRLLAATTVAWLAFAVVAGAGFGMAGALVRDRTPGSWWAGAGLGLTAAVLLAEAWLRVDATATALLTVLVAVAVLGSESRRPGVIARALVLTAPLTALCFVAFVMAGFGRW
ncbi:hypothetical protein GCM10023340_16560 [Nocardioides marinquilinus]|uniref:Uncharacterized protein n=1 Tax=Nocardioides marinquilinus TaxID=1210400 RepID=A0ABP9PJE8_9ACTN